MVTLDDIPNVPKSKLKDSLVEKANELTSSPIKIFSILEEFQERVSNEISFIWKTFPEYTPHDEKHHITPLFNISDKIIGSGYNLTFSELFLLIVGIYGHDWGMAVSEKEKVYILNPNLPIPGFSGDSDFLNEERNAFSKFVLDEGLMARTDRNYETLSDSLWQKYVRETHAQRSSSRVKAFFRERQYDGIARAAGQICLGHSLDFRDLERDEDFPQKFPILGEIANLKAIALYLRIIDLFDIGKTRTPFEIFNFISPTTQESISHWEQHFSIDPIVVSEFFDKGRQIHVSGRTSNPDIYANLEDHKNGCNYQLDRTVKMFSLMNDTRHRFDIVYLDWNIEPEGFKGISIKFDFENKEMFKILSSEIYQRDPFVFLRELLQNSIDAIRLKEEFYTKLGKQSGPLGYIKVNIDSLDDKAIQVTWYDNGIGMDEYIVKNYLSVIGRSSYEKSNLEKLDIKLDPISKFGIGILSCFYVGKEISIKTYKDINIKSDSIPLEIRIPEVNRQFHVKELQSGSIKQGTEITIHIDNSKKFQGTESAKPLEGALRRYLKEIAGFVEFPIIINENGKFTVIQHPYSDNNAHSLVKDYPNLSIERLVFSYPFDSIFLPQDVESAKKLFIPKFLNPESELHLPDFEGGISFLTLPNGWEWGYTHVSGYAFDEVEVKGIAFRIRNHLMSTG